METRPLTSEEYRKLSRKVVKCPVCGRIAEIRKVRVKAIYELMMELKTSFPLPLDKDAKGTKDSDVKELLDRYTTLTAIFIAGMVSPKIALDSTTDSLGIAEIDDCCGKYYMEQIIDFSGMSPKAEEARIAFAKTEPAKTIGLAATLSNSRPSDYIDPFHEMTDYERAALDNTILVEARKEIQRVDERPKLEVELEDKYNLWTEKYKLWS